MNNNTAAPTPKMIIFVVRSGVKNVVILCAALTLADFHAVPILSRPSWSVIVDKFEWVLINAVTGRVGARINFSG